MHGLSRGQAVTLAGFVLAMVVVGVLSFITPLSWLNKPFAGFLVYEPPYVGSYSVQDWPGRQAGLKFLDRILAIDGASVRSGQDVTQAIEKLKPGTPVRYLVESKGRVREVTVPVSTYRVRDFLLTFLATNFLCGLLLLILGVVVVLLKPNIRTSWVFLVWSFCLGTYLISGFEIMSSYRLVRFHYVVACLYPIMAFHLALIFPDRKEVANRHPALEYLIYVPILVLILGWQVYLGSFRTLMSTSSSWSGILSYVFLGSVTRILLLACVVCFIGAVIHSMVKAATLIARRRARLILLGAAVGWLGPVVVMLGSHLLKVDPTWNFLPFLVVFFPISITYSIVKHNLFDADVIIKQTVGYIVVTAAILGIYSVVSVVLNVWMGQQQLSHSRTFPILFTFGVILIFNPLRNRIQAVVDRVFYRAEYDYSAILEQIGRAMTSLLDLDKILQRLTRTFREEMFIDTSSIMLLNPAGTEFQVCLAEGEPVQDLAMRSIGVQAPLIKIFEEGKHELTRYDIIENPRYLAAAESGLADFESLHASLMVPLVYQDKVIGLLSLGEKKSGKSYNSRDIELFRTLANQGAVAIENARLFRENLEKQRMEEELSIARDLQMSMLPAVCPELDGFAIAALSTPAKEVGGDFFDFIEIGSGRLGLVVGDVTGKSVSGALVMSASRSVFRMLSEEPRGIGEIMARANRRLKKDGKSGMFVALLYAVLDTRQSVLGLCSAGQTSPIHISAETGSAGFVEFKGDTFPLGILDEVDYQETQLRLSPGDKVVFFTDGIVEAMNDKQELFGFERFLELLQGTHSLSADALLKMIMARVEEFAGGAPQHDDLTVIILGVGDLPEHAAGGEPPSAVETN